jgi:steroid 5-alpha reductase family enzyme
MGWLSADQTKILWILMLAGYAVIAGLEEMHLEKQFGEEYTEYQQKVGHVIPFIPLKSTLLESLLVILIPYAVLEILLLLPIIL